MDAFMSSAFEKVLLWFNRHQPASWTILFVYAALVTFPHEEVQTVVGQIATVIGRPALYRIAAGLGAVLTAALTYAVFSRIRAHQLRATLTTYWTLTVLLCFGTWALLTANNTELVHYPQYFVPGVLLTALTLSPVEALAWITLAAGLDECWQYWGLHGGWGIPYDFNDILMDLLGGCLGVVFALTFLRTGPRTGASPAAFLRRTITRPGAALYAALIATGLILYATGKLLLHEDKQNPNYWMALSRLAPQPFWFFDATWGPKTFHTMSPVEGPLVLFCVFLLYAVLSFKIEIHPPDTVA